MFALWLTKQMLRPACVQMLFLFNRHKASNSLMQDMLDVLHKCGCKVRNLYWPSRNTVRGLCKLQWSTDWAWRQQMQLRTAAECRKSLKALVEDDDAGWLVASFEHESLTAPLSFYYRDAVSWLKRQYSQTAYRGQFAVKAQEKLDTHGQRVFCAPEDCDAWLGLQKKHNDGCIAAFQVFSDKTVLNFKGTSAWPCRFGLLNAALKVSPPR